MKRAALVLGLLAVLAGPAASATQPAITVYAASSLTNVFPKIAPQESYSFTGSNTLATQIEQGAPADVFAAANMTLPQKLHKDGFCGKPIVFTRNKLVIVVPSANPANIKSIYGLTKQGVSVDIAAPKVPVGAYTQHVLAKLKITGAVMKNVVSEETDVRSVLSKVALGEVDAGFVYATDARTVAGQVKVVRIPASAQPIIRYGICVVTGSAHKDAARAFINVVLGPTGQKQLLKAGFLSP